MNSDADLFVEKIDLHAVRQACALDITEITTGSSKGVSTSSVQTSGHEENPGVKWLTLMIREILGMHVFFLFDKLASLLTLYMQASRNEIRLQWPRVSSSVGRETAIVSSYQRSI